MVGYHLGPVAPSAADWSLILIRQDTLDYAAHPINAYHLMKRTTVQWPELFDDDTIEISSELFNAVEDVIEQFPFKSDFDYGAAFGLLSIQVRYLIQFLIHEHETHF